MRGGSMQMRRSGIGRASGEGAGLPAGATAGDRARRDLSAASTCNPGVLSHVA